ncbi:hypothetical protein GCM10019016_013750 [Streptomyces prasinosporus]|uniref:Uncharacterized protein n=1 Tax=Streptomyces prasinosporus TaxID=68256 RepID=A0ABP6TIT0_9ACTN
MPSLSDRASLDTTADRLADLPGVRAVAEAGELFRRAAETAARRSG